MIKDILRFQMFKIILISFYDIWVVLGVIDRVGRPDPRSRPKSGRDPTFSGVVTRVPVATRNLFWVTTRSGRDPAGRDLSSGRDPVAKQKPFLSENFLFFT